MGVVAFEGGVAMFDHAIQAPKAVVIGVKIFSWAGIVGSVWGENNIQLKTAPPEMAPKVRAIAGREADVSLLFVLWKGGWSAGDQIRDSINRME